MPHYTANILLSGGADPHLDHVTGVIQTHGIQILIGWKNVSSNMTLHAWWSL